jgi:hypothetical protein
MGKRIFPKEHFLLFLSKQDFKEFTHGINEINLVISVFLLAGKCIFSKMYQRLAHKC